MTGSQRDKKRLAALYARLDAAQQKTLLEFAEFLDSKTPTSGVQNEVQEPVIQARPEKESVVKAIRRLSNSYPMLDKARLLNETSSLMSQHVMQGKDAVEVIDQLESFFAEQYQLYLQEKQG